MYNHILLAADGSENALRAAREAAKIAKLCSHTVVTVIYVAHFEKSKTEVLYSSSAETLFLERRKKITLVEQVFKDAQIQYKVEILKGIPGPEIVKYANNNGVDLVVIGSRGLNSLQEMVLGSVSHKVMKRVNCPALIVK
ncbi:universal stress protein [Lysinibacillus sp. 54212]|uniref:universal stress protein n=1 Tax=Lysinibacillus sp. 54212 TaxID=3119829 RepID=UPI002FC72037